MASGRRRESGARTATVGSSSRDGTRLGLGTSATGLGAGTVEGPARDLAINDAALGVAHARLGGRAFITTVLGGDVNNVSAGLGTNITGSGASSPGVPGVFAINGARVSVAVLSCVQSVASLASVGRGSDDRAGASSNAAATKLRTFAPTGPISNNAINRTCLVVASAVLGNHRTASASNHGGLNNGTRTGLGASRARHGARTPWSKESVLAINGATKSTALNYVTEHSTAGTPVLGVRDD